MSIENLALVSLTTSVVVLIISALSPILDKRFGARWKYYVWLVIAVRLLIPFGVGNASAPIRFNGIPVHEYSAAPKQPADSDNVVPDLPQHSEPTVQNPTDNSSKQISPVKPTVQSARKPITYRDIITAVWAIVSLCFAGYHICVYASFRRKAERTSKFVFIKSDIPVYKCHEVSSPMLIGFIKPEILLPDIEYSPEELEVILLHEVTHHKRHDVWYKLLLLIVNAVHFFNPIIYIFVKFAGRDLEYSCDDIVIKNQDTEFKKQYALTVLKSMNGGNNK